MYREDGLRLVKRRGKKAEKGKVERGRAKRKRGRDGHQHVLVLGDQIKQVARYIMRAKV